MIDWRLIVEDEAGVARGTFTPADEVASLDSFSVDQLGGSITGSFTGLPKALLIEPRDIVTLEVEPAGGSFTPVFKGYVTSLPSEFSDELGSYGLVGMRQRLYEVQVAQRRLLGADIAAMVQTVLQGVTLPAGITYSAAAVPTLGFQAGERLPQGESIGDFLDDLAALAGRFIVPGGDTYTYDSVVFDEFETVPAVRWGVDANGVVFFRRPLGAAITLDESNPDTLVEWNNISAEEAANTIGLVYASAYDREIVRSAFAFWPLGAPSGFEGINLVQPTALALIRTLGSGLGLSAGLRRYRKVDVDGPLDYCERLTNYEVDPATFNWSNPSNALDNNIGTVAEATDDFNAIYFNRSTGFQPREAFLAIDYAAPAPVDFRIEFVSVNTGQIKGGTLPVFQLRCTLPETASARSRALIYVGIPTAFDPASITHLSFIIEEAPIFTEIARWNIFVPDVDVGGTLSEQLAEALEKPVQRSAASVQVYGFEPVAPAASLIPLGESPVLVPVERVDYRITVEDGVVTSYQLGQAYDAELEIERVLLQRLARRAVREGGARR